MLVCLHASLLPPHHSCRSCCLLAARLLACVVFLLPARLRSCFLAHLLPACPQDDLAWLESAPYQFAQLDKHPTCPGAVEDNSESPLSLGSLEDLIQHFDAIRASAFFGASPSPDRLPPLPRANSGAQRLGLMPRRHTGGVARTATGSEESGGTARPGVEPSGPQGYTQEGCR